MTFKRFNASESRNYNNNIAHEAGTLTWDSNNGLRLHDGYTEGGNSVGSSTVNWGDIQYRPYGASGVHDIFGGGASVNNGKFLMQTDTTTSAWTSLPTTYDTLTIDTKVIGGTVGDAGTKITGIEASLGSGVPYRYAFVGGNQAFNDFFNRGSSIIGWKMYPTSDPSAFVTITEYLNYDLGAPSLGFSGGLAQGPWTAESADYNAGTPGPLTLSAGTKEWVLGTDGNLTLPAGGDIKDSSGNSVLGGSGFSGSYTDLTDKPTIPADTGDLTNNAGFITSISTPTFEIKSSNFTADAGKYYAVNTSSGSVTVTLPTSPTVGQSIQVVDAAGTWPTNKVYVIPANDVTHPIIYSGTTYGNGTTYPQFNFGGISVSFFWNGTNWRRWA